MLYPFFDVIPKSKIQSIHYKMTETIDLKWIGGREVGLRRSAVTLTMSRAGDGKQSELERDELQR